MSGEQQPRPVQHVDVVIVGAGAMGLATAWSLAPQGLDVVVLERFEFAHDRGASHGDERIFRYLYPDNAYVEMALAADEGWMRLERAANQQLLHRVGSAQHGDAQVLDALTNMADQCGVRVESLTAAEASGRWPQMRFTGDVVVQPDAGWVHAARSLECFARLAGEGGAELRFNAPVASIAVADDHVRVEAGGTTYVADVAVVTVGAWSAALLADLGLPPLKVTEEHVFFFEPTTGAHGEMPSFVHDSDPVRYGLPAPSGLVKVAEHHTGTVTTGDDRTFAADPDRSARVQQYAAQWLPGLVPQVVATKTCLYTSTPSRDFVLDRVGPVVVGAGFSGHGFKFVPEIGRRLAQLATDDGASYPRFALQWHERRSA